MQQGVVPIKISLVKTLLLANVQIDLTCILNAISTLYNPAVNALQGKFTRLATCATHVFAMRLFISRQSLPHSRSRHLRHPYLLSNRALDNLLSYPFLRQPRHSPRPFLGHALVPAL